MDDPGWSTVTDSSDLNILIGATILQGKTDVRKESAQSLRRLIYVARYEFLEKEGKYKIDCRAQNSLERGIWFCESCGETFSPRRVETVGENLHPSLIIQTDDVPEQYHIQREKRGRHIFKDRLGDRSGGN